MREAFLKAIQAAKLGSLAPFGLEQVFRAGFLPAVGTEEVLPFIVVRRGDDAAMPPPGFLEGWFFSGRLHSRIREEASLRAGITPAHGEISRVAGLGPGYGRNNHGRANLTTIGWTHRCREAHALQALRMLYGIRDGRDNRIRRFNIITAAHVMFNSRHAKNGLPHIADFCYNTASAKMSNSV